jgi:hypothetical protein
MWYMFAPVISYISFTLNVSKCIHYCFAYYCFHNKDKERSKKNDTCRGIALVFLAFLTLFILAALVIFAYFILVVTD